MVYWKNTALYQLTHPQLLFVTETAVGELIAQDEMIRQRQQLENKVLGFLCGLAIVGGIFVGINL